MSNERPYKGVGQGLWTIARAEGILALQKGLFPAMLYQFTMNGMRLGTYSALRDYSVAHFSQETLSKYKFIMDMS